MCAARVKGLRKTPQEVMGPGWKWSGRKVLHANVLEEYYSNFPKRVIRGRNRRFHPVDPDPLTLP